MVRLSGIFTAIMLSLIIFTTSCSYNDRNDVPDSAGSDGRGDATNTLRFQNRTVK
jgi:hypothetical protein